MNFKKYFVAALPALLLASCASDEPATGGEDVNNGKAMYARIQIQVPTATRSNTLDKPNGDTNSNAGFEVGQPYENDINNVTIVLATEENGVYTPKASGVYQGNDAMPDPVNENTYTILFKDEDIVQLAGEKVYVFAYCNTDIPTTSFTGSLNEMISSITSGAENQGIWKKGNFMMANAPGKKILNITMPETDALINNYNSAEKALDLGTVEVARTAARFDYKVTDNNLYDIVDINSDDNAVVAQVEMVGMTPFNIAKDFYTLPRVSADGTAAGWTICGEEVGSLLGNVTPNYVVSPFYTEKAESSVADLASKYFFPLPTVGNNGTYAAFDYTVINDWYKAATDDNDENWTGIDGYKIWHYATENTIPAVDNQRKGITTGVIFKGKLTNAQGLMKTAMDAGHAVYFYNGICYGDIANLRRVVANLNHDETDWTSPNKMYNDFKRVFGEEYLSYDKAADGTRVYRTLDADLKDCTSAANNGTFKILRPDEAGDYYTYYVYYNRHNDNGQSTVMGPMEFATVRNNVYKLSVTKVTDFGHTSDPKDDPEPENPDNPDETPKTYFRVSCHVIPWIVRINNIEF